jgi:hypothetical protein
MIEVGRDKKNTNRALQAIEPIRNVSVNYDRLARIPLMVMICCCTDPFVPGPHSWQDSISLVHGPINYEKLLNAQKADPSFRTELGHDPEVLQVTCY